MPLFGKKREEQPGPQAAPATSGTPVEDVLRMRQQGLNNNQIVQALQRSGYKTNQIFDAMNLADLKAAGAEAEEEEDIEYTSDAEPAPEYEQYAQFGGEQQKTTSDDYDLRMEEIAEAIIDEKWQELMKNVSKIVEWKNSMEARMVNLEQKFDALKGEYDKLHYALLDKITEYDSNIKNVGVEIKAMEQVFQKVLPAFTDNVNELSRLTKGIKEKKKEK